MSEPVPAELAGQPLVISLPVLWGDQDSFGHVNNVVYFRWMESSRIEYFQGSELAQLLTGHGLGPILASIKCNYRKQLRHPDTVRISASVTRLGRSSISMSHLLYSDSHQAIAADGDSTIVMFDYKTQRPTPIPADVRQWIERREGKTLSAE